MMWSPRIKSYAGHQSLQLIIHPLSCAPPCYGFLEMISRRCVCSATLYLQNKKNFLKETIIFSWKFKLLFSSFVVLRIDISVDAFSNLLQLYIATFEPNPFLSINPTPVRRKWSYRFIWCLKLIFLSESDSTEVIFSLNSEPRLFQKDKKSLTFGIVLVELKHIPVINPFK